MTERREEKETNMLILAVRTYIYYGLLPDLLKVLALKGVRYLYFLKIYKAGISALHGFL